MTDSDDSDAARCELKACQILAIERGLHFSWRSLPRAEALLMSSDRGDWPGLVQGATQVAVGDVRLDNRASFRQRALPLAEDTSDLALVLRLVTTYGAGVIQEMVGDFAFVIWDAKSRTAVAACDAFSVMKLYHAPRHGLHVFASRAEMLGRREDYDVEYLTRLVALHGPDRRRTVFSGIRPVPDGCYLVLARGKEVEHEYWSADQHGHCSPLAVTDEEAADTCRSLLTESLRQRVDTAGDTWAQLSGGLDSSSVVSLAAWMNARGILQHGLSGTVTYVDRGDTGADERSYSDTVVRMWHVRNEVVVDAPTWIDETGVLPTLDQPTFHFMFHPRDRRVAEVVRQGGGRVLLTGWGGDELFMGNMLFFADWIWRGRVWPAVREMARRASIGRASFWELAYKNALTPLLPGPLRNVMANDGIPLLPWVRGSTLNRYGLGKRSPLAREYAGRLGQKYQHAVSTRIGGLPGLTADGVLSSAIELRHPFLHRPLVEFALKLPPDLCARAQQHRWVLRAAMRDILPERVRNRIGKQDTGEAAAWSLASRQKELRSLLRESILGDLGIVDPRRLNQEFEAVTLRNSITTCLTTALLSTLAVEAWLQVRSGRWPRGGQSRN